VTTHIRMNGYVPGRTDYGIALYCDEPQPQETISLRHYTESIVHGSAIEGHIQRLPSPLCTECHMLVINLPEARLWLGPNRNWMTLALMMNNERAS
jgi:hypothetical protein